MPRESSRGSLPEELRAAAVELIAERGPASFSLREVARRAGVSHAAPGHHFGDSRGLLTSVAIEGWRRLHQSMVDSIADIDDPEEQLVAIGETYLRFGVQSPGYYGVMVTTEHSDHDNPEFIEASTACFALMDDIVSRAAPDRAQGNAKALSIILWATTHGLVEITPVLDHLVDAVGAKDMSADELVRFATHIALQAANP